MKSSIPTSTFLMLIAGLVTLSTMAVAARPVAPPLPSLPTVRYAVTEFGAADLMIRDVALAESGNVQISVYDNDQSHKLYEWSPSTGLQLVGMRDVNPRTEQTPFGTATVFDTNNVGGWVGVTAVNSNAQTTMVVGNASGEQLSIPSPANPSPNTSMLPYDINDKGVVVGNANLPSWPPQMDGERITYGPEGEEKITSYGRIGVAPFVWTPTGGSKLIPSLPQTYGENNIANTFSVAYAVNNQGQVVGSDGLSKDVGNPSNAFIWSELDGIRSLGRLDGDMSAEANDINDMGIVVGTSGKKGGSESFWYENKGFIWSEDYGMLDLNNWLTDVDKARGVTIQAASSINESGQILAVALGGGSARYVLLTPVPEPTTQGLMLLGLISMCAVVRSKSRQL